MTPKPSPTPVEQIDLWLDDMRPAPAGWVHVKTVEEAKPYFEGKKVRFSSLDHDLGACDRCNGKTPEAWLEEHDYKSMPHCEHFGTGYTLVCWLEETGLWPDIHPNVHSANPAGRARMEQVIRKHYFPTTSMTNKPQVEAARQAPDGPVVAWTWTEPASEFNGYEGRRRLSFERPSNTEAPYGMTRLCASPQPASPAQQGGAEVEPDTEPCDTCRLFGRYDDVQQPERCPDCGAIVL